MQRFYEATFHMLERNSNPRKSIDLMRAVKVMQGKNETKGWNFFLLPLRNVEGDISQRSPNLSQRELVSMTYALLPETRGASVNQIRGRCSLDSAVNERFATVFFRLRLILIFVSEFPTLLESVMAWSALLFPS
ncbi:hypothetical protein CEXT_211391 [Caerostris extrusa]|uniref:Uncharacterized protein n=1 Tax=Caerostris extrusa TaxID=172846 RepID=A0AAV4QA36_CAEEX|nr:hypothetical protein CEXT_211391 [Caerostris extrusa]